MFFWLTQSAVDCGVVGYDANQCFSETLVTTYKTTRHHDPDELSGQLHHRGNLISQTQSAAVFLLVILGSHEMDLDGLKKVDSSTDSAQSMFKFSTNLIKESECNIVWMEETASRYGG
jgi:hypothetical protein